jgi:hypothetical protein
MAMPNKVKVFPRGYSGGQSKTVNADRKRVGDPEVDVLFEEFTSHANNSMHWVFRKRVIKCAKRLLSGSSNWFIQQDINPLVTAYNYQFLLDTLRFIATGRRRISIHAWPDLLAHWSEDSLAQVNERHDIADMFRELALSTSTDALLQKWCSNPKGFDDLMYSLNLLFGEAHIKAEPQLES